MLLFLLLTDELAVDLQTKAFKFLSDIRETCVSPQTTSDSIVKGMDAVVKSYNNFLMVSGLEKNLSFSGTIECTVCFNCFFSFSIGQNFIKTTSKLCSS